MDLQERQSSLWGELEGILRMLDVNKQIWFLEKFIDESRKFLSGEDVSYFSCKVFFSGLAEDGSERKSAKPKSARKKKQQKKTVTIDDAKGDEDEVDAEKKPKENLDVSKPDESAETQNPQLNVDSLIQNYKLLQTTTEVLPKTGFLENLLQEDKEKEEEDNTTSENMDTGTKSTRFSKNFKKNRQAMEKTRQNLVKKENENEDKDLERAGQMLRKVKSDVYNVPLLCKT